MNGQFKKGAVTLLSVALLAACGQNANKETDGMSNSEPTTEVSDQSVGDAKVTLEGLGDHYHTGDNVHLHAHVEGDVATWRWIKLVDDQSEVIEGNDTDHLEIPAEDGMSIKAQALDKEGAILGESDPAQVTIDDHLGSDGDETSKRIYNGFFYNDEVFDRELSDWEGQWQSIHTYLADGELDEVLNHKADANNDPKKDFDYYRDYYTKGYETDVKNIDIQDNKVTFTTEDDKQSTAEYEYDGYEILNYERGNRGVRFVYKRSDDNDQMPQYIQFSDHMIAPQKASHYHLYWGNDRAALLDEVENWPTYYPVDYTAEDIRRDMLAH